MTTSAAASAACGCATRDEVTSLPRLLTTARNDTDDTCEAAT